MIVYIPFCVHFYIINTNSHSAEPYPKRDTLFWTLYSLINTFISVTFHCISIWLTVYLAFYRYIKLAKTIFNISDEDEMEITTPHKIPTYLEALKQTETATYKFVLLRFCRYCAMIHYLRLP